jgi:hypothetical protein
MPDSDGYPAWVSEICERVVARLAAIKAIRAVALGGSRARGTARKDSDIDLALYYDSVHAVSDRATQCGCARAGPSPRRRPGHAAGCLGPWRERRLMAPDRRSCRDLRRARSGRRVHPRSNRRRLSAGHPIGFQNKSMQVRRTFADHSMTRLALKLVVSYPPSMRRALIDKHLFKEG